MCDGIGWMDGLSYTAVTPRASLQSDANNSFIIKSDYDQSSAPGTRSSEGNWNYSRKLLSPSVAFCYLELLKINNYSKAFFQLKPDKLIPRTYWEYGGICFTVIHLYFALINDEFTLKWSINMQSITFSNHLRFPRLPKELIGPCCCWVSKLRIPFVNPPKKT